ncbi:MAG: hypothetical protein Q9179_006965 [Wetmoreana sp. 5 TL-2023]
MEPDVERSIACSPIPLADQEKIATSMPIPLNPGGKKDKDTSSLHSATPSTTIENGVKKEEDKDVELAHAPPVKVPRDKRRGLFARFTFLAEVAEPKSYPRSTKWFITFIIALAAVAAPLGSAIILPTLLDISRDLHSTPTVTNLSVAFYLLSMSIFPLWWSSFSETMGRRTIYIVSFTLFVLWNILAAVSTNIAMLIVTRLLGGGAAASVQAVGAGTIADIWEVKERGHAMGIFYLGPLMGPFIAPIIGGVMAEKLGWRSTQWALVIFGGFILFFLFFALPETLKNRRSALDVPLGEAESASPTLTRATSAQILHQRTRTWMKWLKRAFIDPLKILLYLRFPAIAITVSYVAIAFGSLFLLNISLETTFSQPPYKFNTIEVGLTYIPNSIGYILASFFGGKWSDRIMAREAERAGRRSENNKLIYIPEDRMRENAWIAAFLYPAALIWYGWTAEKGVVWPVPLLANFFFGIGSMLIFAMATTMLTEFMPRKASSGVAANNFFRNIFSCIGALTAEPLIGAIGDGWLFTGVGVIALCSGSVIWAMRKYGPRWRESMDAQMD